MISLVLRHRFVFKPVLLSSLAKRFSGLEYSFRFFDLVREYLPEERERLLVKDPVAAAGEFIKLFSKRYFPIRDVKPLYYERDKNKSMLQELTRSIPVALHSQQGNNYEYPGKVLDGQLLAKTICVCPFTESWLKESRVVVVEQFAKLMGAAGAKLVNRLPKDGYRIQDVEQALKESPYPGFLLCCRWLFARTGNIFLDYQGGSIDWSRESVAALTKDWPRYVEMDRQTREFSQWLTADITKRAGEVIMYIAGKVKTRGKALVEIFGGADDSED